MKPDRSLAAHSLSLLSTAVCAALENQTLINDRSAVRKRDAEAVQALETGYSSLSLFFPAVFLVARSFLRLESEVDVARLPSLVTRD